MEYLENLNKEQREAVVTKSQKVLVLAGAGSGKTTVLSKRIAHILNEGANPSEVMAVTFTNKAAKEIKERVSGVLPNVNLSEMLMGTFHSIGNKIIRENYNLLGFDTPNYSIIDDGDKKTILNNLYDINKENIENGETDGDNYFFIEEEVTKKNFSKVCISEISKLKDNNILPNDDFIVSDKIDFDFKKVYEIYERYKTQNNILDYGDLLVYPYRFLLEDKAIYNRYRNKINYILVDEFQDTNYIQEKIVSLLAEDKSLFVVGDDDQSIYGWRGAVVQNFINLGRNNNFEVIKLERNYRSNQGILNAANELISYNKDRLGKNMWTDNSGDGVVMAEFNSYKDEMRYVISKIKSLKDRGLRYKDMAIIYRTSSLANSYETELFSNSIPYIIYGGQSFFDKKEIKSINAYFGFLLNKNSYIDFVNSFSVPKRKGVGQKALLGIFSYSTQNNLDIISAIEEMIENKIIKAAGQVKTLREYVAQIKTLSSFSSLVDCLDYINDEIKIISFFEKDEEEKIIEREENISSLREELFKYDNFPALRENLAEYLENVALVSNSSAVSESGDSDFVNLMTIHASKGLEFKAVFLIGFEGNVLPNSRAMDEGALEEERRLAYVGITRAIDNLFITSASFRPFTNTMGSSMFKRELPVGIKRENFLY